MNDSDLRSHMQAIYDQHGYLTAQLVVDAARPKNSPLHAAVFDRDVRRAAERYYLDRAADLIRKLRIKYVTHDETEAEVREYLSVPMAGVPHRVYKTSGEVAQDPLMRAMTLRDAERDWRTMLARYRHLGEFFDMVRRDLDEAA